MLKFLDIDIPLSLKLIDASATDEEWMAEDHQLFEEFAPLDKTTEKIGADIRKFSPQFQEAIMQCKQNIPERKPSISAKVNIMDHFNAEKIRIQVPPILLKDYEVVPLLPVKMRDEGVLRSKKPIPATPTREAALLKCSSWLETNEEFVTRPASSRARAGWKREKNVVIASRRVKSSKN